VSAGPNGDSGSLAQLVAAIQSGPAAIGRLRTRLRQDRALSAGYLSLGFTVLGALLLVRGLFSLAWSWDAAPDRPLSLAAWGLLVLAFIASAVAARVNGGILPGRFSLLVPLAGSAALVLDLAGFAGTGDHPWLYPTAAVGFGACLVAVLPVQPLRRSAAGLLVLAVIGAGTVLVSWLIDPNSLGIAITNLLLGTGSVLACFLLVDISDRHLGRRIDQAATETLVTAPALGHGVSAASELRRLDGDAERLLAQVAASSDTTGIDATTAARAGELADALRFALVADHEQTWLQIAVAESEHLSRTVRVVDPAVLAARLQPERRRNLLAVTWLCVADAPATVPVLDITFIGAGTGSESDEHLTMAFSMVGTRRRGIDPAVWPLLSRLGRYTVDLAPDRALVIVELA
jgi:hypothetical protein